jgi:predicted ArsR family transcriptional regulator
MEFNESMVVVNYDHSCAIMHIACMISFVLCRSPLEFYNALSDAIQIFYPQHKFSNKSLCFQ